MLTKKELNKHNFPVTPEIDANLSILISVVNKLEAKCGLKFISTSGLRDRADQIRVYNERGIYDLNKIPLKSKHLTGQAVDISDPNQELQTWLYDNVEYMEEIGIWCEAFQFTPNWVHIQTRAPNSGLRFYRP